MKESDCNIVPYVILTNQEMDAMESEVFDSLFTRLRVQTEIIDVCKK